MVIRYKAMDAHFDHVVQYSYMNEILPSGIAKNISSGIFYPVLRYPDNPL